MKKGAAVVLFIALVIAGGFVGFAVALASGQGNEGQSKGTGIGAGAGAVVAVVCIAGMAVAAKWGAQSREEEKNG